MDTKRGKRKGPEVPLWPDEESAIAAWALDRVDLMRSADDLTGAVAGRVVYLGGPITGVAGHKALFQRGAGLLRRAGALRVWDPSGLPPGWGNEEYIDHCLLMVGRCDVLALLAGWQHSDGVAVELPYARYKGIRAVDISGVCDG